MLATQCSSPMAANALIGSQMPMNLLPSVLALVASHSAMHTSQLHMIARMKACRTAARHTMLHAMLMCTSGSLKPRGRQQAEAHAPMCIQARAVAGGRAPRDRVRPTLHHWQAGGCTRPP